MRFLNTIKGLFLLAFYTKVFPFKNIFKGKRVAVIGAADSAFLVENGDYINTFDYIIRVNKAIHSLTPAKMKFVGERTDILFHSFYENNESGGGKINQELFSDSGVKFIINPHHNLNGLRTHLNYYKRNLHKHLTYILPRQIYKQMINEFGGWTPTVGYSALYTVLNSNCEEVYITGFTFFKTPYADNYRDHVKDLDKNNQFIEKQGLHNPDLELKEFIKQLGFLKQSDCKIILDPSLTSIVNNFKSNGN